MERSSAEKSHLGIFTHVLHVSCIYSFIFVCIVFIKYLHSYVMLDKVYVHMQTKFHMISLSFGLIIQLLLGKGEKEVSDMFKLFSQNWLPKLYWLIVHLKDFYRHDKLTPSKPS